MKVQEIVVFFCGLLRGEGGGGKTLTAKIREAGILLTSPDKMRESLENLFDIAYLLAKKRRTYSDFSELISLQKMHEVKFSVSYNSKSVPNLFVSSVNQYLKNLLKVRLCKAILLLFYVMKV